MKHLYSNIFFLLSATILFWIFGGVLDVQAAGFEIKTIAPSCRVGGNITLDILLNSPEVAANAIQGTIRFSPNLLTLVDLNTKSSLIQFWVQEPIKNNVSGLISFEGAILNPGYLGKAGKILELTFSCRQEGAASIVFTTGSILANDGKGTNILDKLSSIDIAVLQKAAVITDTGIIAGTKASPKLILEPLARQETNPIATFLFKLQEADNPDYYEVVLDQSSPEIWPLTKGLIYKTPLLDFGNHTLTVRAIYKNNYTLIASQDFVVGALAVPTFENLPSQITIDDALKFDIVTKYPLAKVQLELQPLKGGTPIITVLPTDTVGYLKIHLSGLLNVGAYLVKAKVILEDSSSSPYSTPIVLQVEQTPLRHFQTLSLSYLKIVVILGAVVLVLTSVIFFIIERIKRYNVFHKKVLDASFVNLDTEGGHIIELSDGVSGFNSTEHQSLYKFKELIARIKKALSSTKL